MTAARRWARLRGEEGDIPSSEWAVKDAAGWCERRGLTKDTFSTAANKLTVYPNGDVYDRREQFIRSLVAALETQPNDGPLKTITTGRAELGEYIADGTNDVTAVTFWDDENKAPVRGYHKPFNGLDYKLAAEFDHQAPIQPLHEVAAWRIAEIMGEPWSTMIAPSVLREVEGGDLGSVSQHVDGGVLVTPDKLYFAVDSVHAMAVFDSVIGNADRHRGNFFVTDDLQIRAFDHGYAFSRPANFAEGRPLRDEAGNQYFLRCAEEMGCTQLTELDTDALERLLDGMNQTVTPILEPERAGALKRRIITMLIRGAIMNRDAF